MGLIDRKDFIPAVVVGIATDLSIKALGVLVGGGLVVAVLGGLVWYFTRLAEASPYLRLAIGTCFVLILMVVWFIGFVLVAKPTRQQTRAATPRDTFWEGVRWRFSNFQAVPYCPRDEHKNQRLVFNDGNQTYSEFRARMRGDTCRLQCPADDGHPVLLNGIEWPTSMQYESARTNAEARLRML